MVYCPSTGVGVAGFPVTETNVRLVDAPRAMDGNGGPGFPPLPKSMLTMGWPREPVQSEVGTGCICCALIAVQQSKRERIEKIFLEIINEG